ncbi:ABC transporter ATP-binding protein [Brevibacillus daliensis]|uniref:ABC transporter ATP-binding protein n=1 Tax=Brevibacillus daliensis TaxID=2892995 RepID=UPI001E3C520B|nr:ABC transporter ATP-binding protein [Brevibacillus daliensis]
MLKLSMIHKSFNQGTVDERVALNNIQLQLAEGDFVTVIGSNGAGKSTLMNIISGVLQPDEGTIEIDGRVTNRMPEYDRGRLIGRVFQDPMAGTSPAMTIEENMAIAYGRDKQRTVRIGVNRKRREMFKETLETLHLGLENRLSAKVGLLSGGERQALSLVMATFTKPKVLLLDEHTAALDPSREQIITKLTKEIVERDKLTTLMITHNMQQALDLGNRLIMMDSGTIILDVPQEKKQNLTIQGLINEFSRIRGANFVSDRTVLA